jgi:hypothetical protein
LIFGEWLDKDATEKRAPGGLWEGFSGIKMESSREYSNIDRGEENRHLFVKVFTVHPV